MKHAPDVICLSHLRWSFVFQRPNHLMSECARERRVFFVEEPLVVDGVSASAGRAGAEVMCREVSPQLFVVTPRLAAGADPIKAQREILMQMCLRHNIADPILWFYTPMALAFAADLPAALTVYDCMDELSAFHGAPPALPALEHELFERADLVFTGGQSLYEAKRRLHPRVHLFPSSVDLEHFRRARKPIREPAEQAYIPAPRIGYFGVIDERLDLELLEQVARQRPEWSLVMIGPVVKIDPRSLPRLPNIHYLGKRAYEELPAYLAGWQVALMPFALNASTRFISPTKTLEYLAGGKSVVSTPIRDVVVPYAERGLVRVAERGEFVSAIEDALAGRTTPDLGEVDKFIAQTSWQRTWAEMSKLMERSLQAKESRVARDEVRNEAFNI